MQTVSLLKTIASNLSNSASLQESVETRTQEQHSCPCVTRTVETFLVYFAMNSCFRNIQFKNVQRTWKSAMAWFSRKCKVPKQLLLFFVVVCIVVFYTLINRDVLTVSDELVDLQSQVDTVKSFRSVKLDLDQSLVAAVPSAVNDSLSSTWEPSEGKSEERAASHSHLRVEIKDEPVVEVATSTIQISGTLSQIIPERIEGDSGFVASYLFKYPAFVLPPPFSYETSRRKLLPSISSYYRELSNHKRDECRGEDICVHPSHYVNLYTSYGASDPVSSSDKEYIVFFQSEYLRGRIDVAAQGMLPFDYDCGCFSDHSRALARSLHRPYRVSGTVVFLLVPNGATIHHFIDSVLPKLVQLEVFLNDPAIRFLLDISSQYPLVTALLERLGIAGDRLLNYKDIKHLGDGVTADRFVMTCNTPPLHPYLWQRAQYLLRLPHLVNPSSYHQNTILYLSRRKGTIGGGRKVANEQELERKIQQFASEHGYNYVSFFHSDYGDLEELLRLWSSAVAVVGPHGGAFSNILFAPKGCYVIEFLPNGPIFTGPTFKEHLSTYFQAMLLGHRYFAVMSPFTKRDDMTVNEKEVLNILQTGLLSSPLFSNKRYLSPYEPIKAKTSWMVQTNHSIQLKYIMQTHHGTS